MLEEQRRDAEIARRELVEDLLRVVGAVVAPHARVIAADDEVRAAVVLARDRVEDRLARPGVAHRRGIHAQQHAILRIVVLDQHAVALHPRVGRDVVALGLADQRIEQQAVADLERRFLDVLMRAMHRIARLESDDAPPAFFGKERPQFARRVMILGEFLRLLLFDQRDFAAQ